MKTNWGLWMADATDTLKYAAAAALLMAGAAPAYYYIMYIPQRDALARQAQQAEADKGRMAADAFVSACESLGFELAAAPVREVRDDGLTFRVRLLELRRAVAR